MNRAVTDGKFGRGDRVTKTKGSSWTGRVVGFYSTTLTPVGYVVESENEPGSAQIYPQGALAPAPVADGEWVRHKKRGTTYEVLGNGEIQLSTSDERIVSEGLSLVVYRAANGKIWLRFPDEFSDGRFESVATPVPPDAIRQEREACAKIADAAKKSCATKASDARARNDTVAEGLFESACGEAFDIAAAIRAREP